MKFVVLDMGTRFKEKGEKFTGTDNQESKLSMQQVKTQYLQGLTRFYYFKTAYYFKMHNVTRYSKIVPGTKIYYIPGESMQSPC